MDVIGPPLSQQQARGSSTEGRQRLRSEPGVGRKRRAGLGDAVQNLQHLAETDLGLSGPDA